MPSASANADPICSATASRRAVTSPDVAQRAVAEDELRARAEAPTPTFAGVDAAEVDARRRRVRVAEDGLLVVRAPAAHLDLRHLLGGRDARHERVQVGAEHERERRVGQQRAGRRRGRRVDGLLEVQLVAAHREVVADLPGPSAQEVEVALVRLRDELVDRRRILDLAEVEAGVLRRPGARSRPPRCRRRCACCGRAAGDATRRSRARPRGCRSRRSRPRAPVTSPEISRILASPPTGPPKTLTLAPIVRPARVEHRVVRVAEAQHEHVRQRARVVDDDLLDRARRSRARAASPATSMRGLTTFEGTAQLRAATCS